MFLCFTLVFFHILVAVPKLIGMLHTRGEESLVLLSSLSVSMCVYFFLSFCLCLKK